MESEKEENTSPNEITLTKEEELYYSRLRDISFNNLVLSSGGMSGIIAVGALNFIYGLGKLDSIKNYIGCSAGSMIELLLLIGYTPFEISQAISEINNEKEFMNFNITNLIKNYGIYDNIIIKKILESIVIEKLGFIPTMKELFEMTEKTFTCVVFNYSLYSLEYIDYKTNPTYLCTDVVASSSCIPIVFNPVELGEYQYIDGGIMEPFPISYCKKTFEGNTLGLVLLRGKENKDSSTLLKYITYIIFLVTTIKKNKQYFKYINDANVCIINLDHSNKGMKFNMDSSEKIKLFAEGDVQVRKKYKLLLNKSK